MSQHRHPAPWRNRFSAVVHAPPRDPDAGSAIGNGLSAHLDPSGDVGCLTDILGDAALADRHRYTARAYDAAPWLHYNRACYYNPTPSRWLTSDPLGYFEPAPLQTPNEFTPRLCPRERGKPHGQESP
jgi:RHS repeat-associated protein